MLSGPNDQTIETKLAGHLIDDIARLPIISNRAQELWLGIQLQAARRVVGHTPRTARGSLAQAYTRLTAAADVTWAERIDIGRWADELLAARRNIYELHHSRLRRLLDWLPAEDTAGGPRDLFHETVEWLALLPDSMLHHLVCAADAPAIEWETLERHASAEMSRNDYADWAACQAQCARDQLVTGYLRYALRLARNAVGGALDFPDLAQYGFLGLMRAAERFDYRVNARFGTYAASWIWQSIGRALVDDGLLIRLPVHIHDKLNRLARLVARYDTGHSDPLCDPALLAEAGFADARAHQVTRLVLQTRDMRSLDSVAAGDDGSETDNDALRSAVDRLLTYLTPRQREVMELRYGLLDGQDRTLEEVGRHYGLTRERIRQIEARAVRTLERRRHIGALPVGPDILCSVPTWSIAQVPLPPVYLVELMSANPPDDGDWAWLDALLARLPHSSWHAARHGRSVPGGRAGQLRQALLLLGSPAHFRQIAETVNETAATGEAIEEVTAYNILSTDERVFLLLGEGVFSLVEWEQARADEPRPVLPYCPTLPPNPPDMEDGLFESVFVGRELLAGQPTAAAFVAHLLRWAAADPLPRPWVRQGILSTYYLLGLIPYVCLAGGDDVPLRTTMPDMDVQALRRACLAALTERLAAMPPFWRVLQQMEAARLSDLSELFAELRPDGPDDAPQRLAILRSLGAVERLSAGRYRLTALGRACAAEWAAVPAEPKVAIDTAETFDGDLFTWSLL